MKKFGKLFIASAILFGIGVVLTVFGAVLGAFKQHETISQDYLVETPYDAIEIETTACEVVIVQERRDTTLVSYTVPSSAQVSVYTKDNILHIEQNERFFPFYQTRLITLTMPEREIPVSVESDAAAIKIRDGALSDCTLDTNAGAIHIENCSFRSLSVDTDAGATNIQSANIENRLYIESNAGAVKLKNVTANAIEISTNAGAIEGKQIAADTVIASTDLGAIELNILGVKADYTIRADVGLGSQNVSDQTGRTDKLLELKADLGSVKVTFSD